MALSPCFIANLNEEIGHELGMTDYRLLDAGFYLLGMRSLLGPNWLNEIDEVCFAVGDDSDTCEFMRNIPLGPTASKELGTIDGWSEVSVKATMHMGQNYIT